ncbi:B-cell CLL/lymphoma 9 protein isoform X7 [Equus przewalskii]|uniref:B-cell CLL/lymphoma 9 protein isoform X7 n=1 Tax=Equus przewalskii TaxID=9798 RepID=A0ABM4NFH9_EQUPR
MHSSNPKVRNSPSGNTQSSPKSKQEVMVRPPTVMSPSGNPQLDSKFSNQECNSADHIKSQDSQHTPHSMTPSNATVPRSSTPSHGQTTAPDPTPAQKTPAKVVYVFSTEMANKAAEAVLKGQVETIVSFHIQNISSSKTERSTAPLNTQISALRNDPKPLPQQPPAPANQDQNSSQNSRLQPTPPIPAPAPKPAAPPRPLDRESPGVENKLIPSVGSPASSTPLPPDGTGPNSTPNNRAVTPVSQGSNSSSADPKAPPPPPVSSGEPPTLGENPDGLSQEQLEHRERSLQTLRDIQRMLFPDEKEFTGGQSGGPQQNTGVLDGPQKKPEGPIQAMMAQSQSLGKGPGPRTDVGAPFGPQGHRDMPFSPDEMVPPSMNSQSGPIGPDHLDHMTPEQIAWLKLQQEFYEEKRRKQEQVVVQQCSLQDMMVHQHGPRGVVRGPPPPYQMTPSEGWGPGGAEPFADGINMPHSLPPRGMAPHPNIPGSQMRLPGFAGMINSEMEGPNVPNPASRPGLSGVSWPDDVPKIPDGRNFPPGQGVFSGPGRGERFPNPQGLSEEMFQQQLAEKQLGLPPGMSMEGIRPSMEMNRMIPGSQRHMEPGSNPIFPRIPVEGPLSPSRGDFPKGMPPQMGPGRELEFGMVPSGMKGDVSLNVNMGSNSQMIPQKMREAGAGPEEMMKLRPGGADMLPAQQKMVPLPFGGPPPPTASQSASVNIPGSLPSSTPYTMPPEPTLSQNPLSIMMSRMSKFAMPSSTPLYHDAIKTVASSDDDSPPARSPNLPSMNNMPGPNPVVPMPTLSPMGMTQPLSHSNQMPSPNAMGPSIPPHGVPMGPGLISHNPIMGHGTQEPPMVPQGRMGFPQGFPPVQSPPQQVPFPHNGPSGGQGNFPGGMGFPGEGPLGRPSNLPQSSADAALCKPGGPGAPDSFAVLGNSMPSVFTDPDLQEVIRPGATGIPEFDLSRIIPSEKPSQTLQYFPRGEVPGRKQPQGPGPGFSHMQGMMGEQAPRMGLALPGMGGPGPVGTPDIPLGTAPSMPGHNPMRPPAFLQQGMMGPHHRMMSPAQSTMPGQPTLMSNPAAAVGMIPGKDRGPAGLYTHPGPVGSPGMMMSMQGMMGPQQNIMIPPQMRPRGMAADVGMGGFSQGPGNPGNMMF